VTPPSLSTPHATASPRAREEPRVRWVADGAVEGEAKMLVRVQLAPFLPRIYVLTEATGWRNDAQLKLHRMGSGLGWLVTETEARSIAASWGHEHLDAWDTTVPALDDSSPA
jgi:hypothetical protein